ncbi:aldehyde dehydrogenase family protein [Lentzea sp. NEAU-D7]|uniref:aldehyde dehydrogenase family protein n=1 Tax=Lentzea sp. NEAU-D7 TaxID=2994667 RepID=UPI00224A88A6|nr:aldehyde dehydrogenase family protein [Lentzea sp. NEAU-D7]MCX2954552.1 aldehyde dehydrogenase family protein [Lentzea sp. NEAU-D7]
MRRHTHHYIKGRWLKSDTGVIEVLDPTTEEVAGLVSAGGPEDVTAAVDAAAGALVAWSRTTGAERAAHLDMIALLLEDRADDLAKLVTAECGMPIRRARLTELERSVANWRSYADLARHRQEPELSHCSLTFHRPAGVVGVITPWHDPLHHIALTVAAALAAGCTVVLKPSELAPLNAFALAHAVDAAGLPPGVFNLVAGSGRQAGEALAGNPLVDVIAFAGSSSSTSRRVGEIASRTGNRVCSEHHSCGTSVVLDDADLYSAVHSSVRSCMTTGPSRATVTRMLVPKPKYEKACELAREAVEALVVGDPHNPATEMGPQVSARHKEEVLRHVSEAVDHHAVVITGGLAPPRGTTSGYFVVPTVLGMADCGAALGGEAFRGPVLSISPHLGDVDAIALANASQWTTSATVWSCDISRAVLVASRLRAGNVDVNGGFWAAEPLGEQLVSHTTPADDSRALDDFLVSQELRLPRVADPGVRSESGTFEAPAAWSQPWSR